jgi:hypothetical protein
MTDVDVLDNSEFVLSKLDDTITRARGIERVREEGKV